MYKSMKCCLLLTLFVCCLFVSSRLTGQSAAGLFRCGDNLVDDRDGQVYPTVQIGSQCWMARNLNIGKTVPDFNQAGNGVIEKTCYDNDPQNCEVFGGLYTWYETMDGETSEGERGICPPGWQVPSRADWDQLRRFLGYIDAGQQVKVEADHDPAWDGTNSSGFSALPAGVGHDSYFGRKGHWSLFWTSTEVDGDYAWFAQLDRFWYPAPEKYRIIYLGNHFKKMNGFSVRCIKSNSLE